jgi:hypothetical protein
MTSVIDRVRGQLGREYDIVIGAERIRYKKQFHLDLTRPMNSKKQSRFQNCFLRFSPGKEVNRWISQRVIRSADFSFRHPCFAKLWDLFGVAESMSELKSALGDGNDMKRREK